MNESQRNLERAFTTALWKTAAAAKALKPSMPATAFRQMLTEHGGKGTADRLLRKTEPSDGFNELYLRGKEALKLSLEYVALSSPWHQLFTQEQLQIARKRLLDVGCELPPSVLEPGAGSSAARAAARVEPLAEEVSTGTQYVEGAVRRIEINSYERNPEARAACIAHFGSACFICGFDFGMKYGEEFSGFIHVHHLKQIASVGSEYCVDPLADLRPVCPNCHAIVHYGGEMRTLEHMVSITRK